MMKLPIDEILDQVVSAVGSARSAVVVAPPGAGKSTRVPPALMRGGMAGEGEIVVLQPRRLAARLLAGRVADGMGEKVGETVGYQVRLEEAAGPGTKIRFVTEGILSRRFLTDPRLKRASVVILDEFHERHIQGDLALALLRRLQLGSRPDLKIVVMSATIDPAPLAAFLGDAPVLRSEGRLFDVQVRHAAPDAEKHAVEENVRGAVLDVLREAPDGDILVFLPGAAEIRRCAEALSPLAAGGSIEIAPLHGDLPLALQERAVRPGEKRKVILSTNVAETSITIEGVTAVVDSGLARSACFSPSTGMNVLNVVRISKSSAKQRAGRAGRVRPGVCLRLYGSRDYAMRPEEETPEILRLDLSETILILNALGVKKAGDIPWLSAPPAEAVEAGQALLRDLGALSIGGELTDLGKSMLRFPLHPRISRLLIEAGRRGRVKAGAVLAAILGEKDIGHRARPMERKRGTLKAESSGDSDLLESLELFEKIEAEGFKPGAMRRLDLDAAAVSAVKRQSDHLLRLAGGPGKETKTDLDEDDLLKSILAAFPDRVARRRGGQGGGRKIEFVLASGGSAFLDDASVVRGSEWVVAADIDQRRDGAKKSTMIRRASAIETDWLIEMFLENIGDARDVTFNDETGRLEAVRRMTYGRLVIESKPDRNPDPQRVAQALFQGAWSRGIAAFDPRGDLERWLARVEFMRRHFPEAGFPRLDEKNLAGMLPEFCAGKRSLKDLAEGDTAGFLESKLTPEQRRLLARNAPLQIHLPSGRRLKIVYPPGGEPCAASRIQDFFGMKKGPSIAGGRVPLVLHLLAPNMRAVQVTADLEGFWKNHYPKIARELKRRYPRHAWPDDPAA
jgi:ATP-dependent helicase HrpB